MNMLSVSHPFELMQYMQASLRSVHERSVPEDSAVTFISSGCAARCGKGMHLVRTAAGELSMTFNFRAHGTNDPLLYTRQVLLDETII